MTEQSTYFLSVYTGLVKVSRKYGNDLDQTIKLTRTTIRGKYLKIYFHCKYINNLTEADYVHFLRQSNSKSLLLFVLCAPANMTTRLNKSGQLN